MKLYEISKEYETALLEAVDENGEISQDAWNSLDQIEDKLKDKAIAVACMVKNHKAQAKMLADEIAALTKRKKQAENKADWLKGYLESSLVVTEKIDGGKAVISWRKSTSVNITGDVPAEYLREQGPPPPDKTKIKAAIKSGETVPGAELLEKQNMVIS